MVSIGERIVVVETKLNELDNNIIKLDKKIDNFQEKFDNFTSALDNKYASKLTEKIVYGLVGLILTAFITKMLSLW